ncbi:MAG: hypothetical protein NVSMB18_12750 [Acetobacteraceae bacterium]
MIHHVCIPARDPGHVAAVLAELMGGRCLRVSGADRFMATGDDEHGTMIEVVPDAGADPAPTAFRLLLSTPSSSAVIDHLAKREGWRTRTQRRGAPGEAALLDVTELWVENRFAIELAPEDLMDTYLDGFLSPPAVERAPKPLWQAPFPLAWFRPPRHSA